MIQLVGDCRGGLVLKELYRQCPICGGRQGIVYYSVKMKLPENVMLPDEYDVVSCSQCGFAYADVNVSQKEYNTYYGLCNIYSKNAPLKAGITGERERLRCMFLEKYAHKDSRILDIGCGGGGLLRCLKKRGFENLFGMDPSSECIGQLKEWGIGGRIQNAFDGIPEELKNSFDVVMSTAVMEHIYDLNAFVEQMDSWLKWGGRLYVEVPAVEGFERFYTQIPNYFNHEHINYFSLTSLDNLFSKHGYVRKSPDAESLVTLGNPEYVLSAIYEKAMKKDISSGKSIENYFRLAREKGKEDYDRIQTFLEDHSQIIVWGTGAYAMQILGEIHGIENKIVCFIDNNNVKIGQRILEKEIYGPEKLLELPSVYPILICSMRNSEVIKEQIEKMGIGNHYLAI